MPDIERPTYDGPYVITTKQDDDRNCDCMVPVMEGAGQHSPGCACFQESRRAVATLEEVHQAISDARVRACDTANLAVFDFDDETLPRSGGTVGPLPDGTVIEVGQGDWGVLMLAAGFDPNDGSTSYTGPEIIDAYNAANAS